MNSILETAEYIIKGIVATPNEISLDSQEVDQTTVITVNAPPELVGQLIGKQGKIVKAIRTILTLTYPQQRFLLEFKS